MYASKPFLEALYNDVVARLPLWSTTYDTLEETNALVVKSTWVDPDGRRKVKVFLGVEANTRAVIAPETVALWVRHVSQLYSIHLTDGFLCYLCFIDAAGSVSYYLCETAVASP
jgi:hypothetical protein